MKIKCDNCPQCGNRNVPGVESQDGKFMCANCDRPKFEVAAEKQKEDYLSGRCNLNA